jgi:hypothetical protein
MLENEFVIFIDLFLYYLYIYLHPFRGDTTSESCLSVEAPGEPPGHVTSHHLDLKDLKIHNCMFHI